MAGLNTISEGQPITYELINTIIAKLQDIPTLTENFGQDIEVYGKDLGQSEKDRVKIVTGIKQFEIKANDINTNFSVAYEKGGNFSKDNIVVVCSIVDRDTSAGKKGGSGVQMANATITKISKTDFEVNVRILKSVKNNVALELHYIAIGAGPQASR